MSLESPWLGVLGESLCCAWAPLSLHPGGEYHQRLGPSRNEPGAAEAGAAGDSGRLRCLSARPTRPGSVVELGLAVAGLRLSLPCLWGTDIAAHLAWPGNAAPARRGRRPVRSTRSGRAARKRNHDWNGKGELAVAATRQRVVPAPPQGVGPGSSGVATGARGFDDRPAQRFAHRTLLPPRLLRAHGGSVRRMEGRPGRHHRRPGRHGRSHSLDRAGTGAFGGPAWQVRDSGKPRCRASAPARSGALADAGFASLEGRWCTMEENGARLAVGGTSAPWGPALLPGSVPAADFRILLSHSPDQFYRARDWGVDLMLSGHNHGGQIRLPALGPVFMPSVYSRRFDRGFFRSGSTFLYVSEGVAGKHPYRYGCPPEICCFVLKGRPEPGHPMDSAGRDRAALGRLPSCEPATGCLRLAHRVPDSWLSGPGFGPQR